MADMITRQYGITKDGVRCTVELIIDIGAIAHDMVNKAARNSSGKAVFLHGSVVAKVIDRATQQEGE